MTKPTIIDPNFFNPVFTGLGSEKILGIPHELYGGPSIYINFTKEGSSNIRASMPYANFPCVDLTLESEFFGLINPVTHVLVPNKVIFRLFGNRQLREMLDVLYMGDTVQSIIVDQMHRIEFCLTSGKLSVTIFTVVDTGTVGGVKTSATAAFNLLLSRDQYDQMRDILILAVHSESKE